MTLLKAENISKRYGTKERRIDVLRNINLSVRPGEMTAIIGASGSGKTTLLQVLGTLDIPSSGELYFREEQLYQKSAPELAAFRNRSIGFIFQFHHLLPDFTTLENVMMPGLIAGLCRKTLRHRAEELLHHVELEGRLHHKVLELSGGEQQRTALARALIMSPALLLADEPTGNLDFRAGQLVFELLQKFASEQQLTTIMVTHNTELAHAMDRCLTLQDGQLEDSRS